MSIRKREKIFIALALLAALYAGGRFLFSGSGREPDRPAVTETPAEAFLMEIAESLARNRLTETETAILEKAGMPWPPDPFVRTGTPSSMAGGSAPSPASGQGAEGFSYTGYMEAGNRRLAVINDREYEIGERVAGTSFTVRSISLDRILLEDAEGREYAMRLQDGADRGTARILRQSE